MYIQGTAYWDDEMRTFSCPTFQDLEVYINQGYLVYHPILENKLTKIDFDNFNDYTLNSLDDFAGLFKNKTDLHTINSNVAGQCNLSFFPTNFTGEKSVENMFEGTRIQTVTGSFPAYTSNLSHCF